MALGVGITSYVARSVGAKDYAKQPRHIRHALLLLVCVGVAAVHAYPSSAQADSLWMGAAADILRVLCQLPEDHLHLSYRRTDHHDAQQRVPRSWGHENAPVHQRWRECAEHRGQLSAD